MKANPLLPFQANPGGILKGAVRPGLLANLAVLAVLSGGALSCSSTGGTSQTAYIPYQMGNPDLRSRSSEDSPIDDFESHWEGDGVSGPPKIVIDVSDQRAYFYKGAALVGVSKVSSGRDGYATPLGSFKIIQKNRDHESNLYGDYVYPDGRIAMKDVDTTKDKKPPGTIYDGADMPYFMRFVNGVGMHAGYLPGFAASHGCVRMPKDMAKIYFDNVELGTPVIVQP